MTNYHWKDVDSYFCVWPYWMCICRSFPFRRQFYGRSVFKWITQWDFLTYALVKLLVFAPLFNTAKKHVLNYFALCRHCREQRAHGKRDIIFFSHIHLFGMPVEHIIRKYSLPSHVIFNLLQQIKDNLEPSTRSHAIPGLSKLHATLNFLASGFFQHTVASLFLNSLFATTQICAALGILRWSICKWDVATVFFMLCIVSKSPG